ncbi:polysaccharide lyase family 8 super-sandwich domain-containing protein [Rhizosphaericola mali]|uniref:Chondroitin AC lyase n=1 Tax=Rhizosphaericola mali TaxID=2545455 RepID=A0A5P2G0M3_9BACT|nr:polysaccharide lyase family 8 super-sandwich domain-containing protein [Rhizosphaericola mali]QES89354.1 hypothetical protein E0W69_012000 [Rhizosphaericola mali]
MTYTNKFIFLIFLLIFTIFGKGYSQQWNVYDSIMNNIRNVEFIEEPNIEKLDRDIAKNLTSISENSFWNDINYNSTTQTAWSPGQHLRRLHTIAIGFANKKSKYYQNQKVLQTIIHGLQFWYDKNPISTNWYNQQIFCPKQVGVILILLKTDQNHFPISLSNKLLDRMERIGGIPNGQYSSGSSNRINISAHWIYRACLQQQKNNLDFAVEQALLTFKFNEPGGGLQPDFSFQEHGKQLYIGNYGYGFLDNLSNISLYLKNTQYAISPFQLYLLSTFCLDTYNNVIRGKYYSYSVLGRQMANKNELDRSKSLDILYKMKQLDTINDKTYAYAISRWNGTNLPSSNIKPTHRHFYFSDYSFYNTSNYFFDVRFVSNRTVRTENINNEDKKGYFLSDGAYNILVKGDEYFNIFPTWDWCHIPGTTAPHYDSLPDLPIGVGSYPGTSKFAGGLSDSLIGISTYSMDYPIFKTNAIKSWFIFDGAIICLGAEIQSNSDQEIHTTINQCNWVGNVKKIHQGINNYILHNNIAYQIPTNENYVLQTNQKFGNWKTISDSQKDSIVSQSVFSLWLNHHKNPANATYQYTIIPNIHSKTELEKFLSKHQENIICNDSNIQAVCFDGIIQATFLQNNKILKFKNIKITSDKACLLMIRPIGINKYKISISDPSQSLSDITIKGTIDNVKVNKQINLYNQNRKGATISMILNTK